MEKTTSIRIFTKDLPRINVARAPKGLTQPELISRLLDQGTREDSSELTAGKVVNATELVRGIKKLHDKDCAVNTKNEGCDSNCFGGQEQLNNSHERRD